MDYLDYRTLRGEYTTAEVAKLFEMSERIILYAASSYGITPRYRDCASPIFTKAQVCDIHNKLYKNSRYRSRRGR